MANLREVPVDPFPRPRTVGDRDSDALHSMDQTEPGTSTTFTPARRSWAPTPTLLHLVSAEGLCFDSHIVCSFFSCAWPRSAAYCARKPGKPYRPHAGRQDREADHNLDFLVRVDHEPTVHPIGWRRRKTHRHADRARSASLLSIRGTYDSSMTIYVNCDWQARNETPLTAGTRSRRFFSLGVAAPNVA